MVNCRNNTIEILKLFAAYMVVFIHVPFYGGIDAAVDSLARFAVPFFFLVSGFYSYRITTKKIKQRIIRLFFLLLFSALIYIIYKAATFLIQHDFQGLEQYFNRYLNPKYMLKLLLFNEPNSAVHLWYLYAILYIYFILYLVTRTGVKDRVIWTVSFLTLCLQLIFGEAFSAFGISLPICTVRNFALMGIPFFGMGMMINKYKHKLAGIPNFLIFISISIGIFETLCARYFFGKNELYIGSILILFAFVIVFIKFPDLKYPSALMKMAGCNTYIYILHPMVSGVLKYIYALLRINSGWGYSMLRMIHPLAVCAVSTVLAYVLNKILSSIENK